MAHHLYMITIVITLCTFILGQLLINTNEKLNNIENILQKIQKELKKEE